MNRRLASAFVLVLAGPASAETVHDAIAAAYTGNPSLLAARARQQALTETPEQAGAAGRLAASAQAGAGYDRFDYGKGGGSTIDASLPIWTGGRVKTGIQAAEGDVAAGADNLRDTQAGILENVIGAYANILYDQQAVEIAQADIALLDNEVAESRARYKLGNATRTDLARLEAQAASARATLAAGHAAVETDSADYRAAVGSDPGILTPPPDVLPALPGTLDQARKRALAANPLFSASQHAVEAAAARVRQARANGNPSIALGGAYGYDDNIAANRSFPVAANVGVVLTVPILTGGLVASQVRQARDNELAARYDNDAARREAIRSTEADWAAVTSARAEAAANSSSVEAAELALKGVRAEFAFGLRSTLDILVADESLRSAQLALVRNQADLLIAEGALLHATGRLDADAFTTSAAKAADFTAPHPLAPAPMIREAVEPLMGAENFTPERAMKHRIAP